MLLGCVFLFLIFGACSPDFLENRSQAKHESVSIHQSSSACGPCGMRLKALVLCWCAGPPRCWCTAHGQDTKLSPPPPPPHPSRACVALQALLSPRESVRCCAHLNVSLRGLLPCTRALWVAVLRSRMDGVWTARALARPCCRRSPVVVFYPPCVCVSCSCVHDTLQQE